jgi:hypothetical protein
MSDYSSIMLNVDWTGDRIKVTFTSTKQDDYKNVCY